MICEHNNYDQKEGTVEILTLTLCLYPEVRSERPSKQNLRKGHHGHVRQHLTLIDGSSLVYWKQGIISKS